MQQDNQAQNNEISADQVSDFLRSHPHFFEQHASLLTEIHLPSPHGNGTISLAERQQLAQRDKIRVIEVMMAQLIEIGEENDTTSEKVHGLSIKLIGSQGSNLELGTSGFSALQQLIAENMQQKFSVTQSLLRIWLTPSDNVLAQDVAFTPVDDAFSDWVTALNTPFCGAKPALTGDLLGDHLQSFAFIPLYKEQNKKLIFGVLILGSEDQQRFKAGMGTIYLERIGELVSAALAAYF